MMNSVVESKNIDWVKIEGDLQKSGFASFGKLLSSDQSDGLAALYSKSENFRSKVVMSRHNFGKGEYQYFSYPLPVQIGKMRRAFYEGLAPIANKWAQDMKMGVQYPEKLEQYLGTCHEKGQLRSTPLLLKYGPGDFNCLHQDIYGEEMFPIQIAICLSKPDIDFTGGEFVLTHQRPRMQSVVDVVSMKKGEAIAFAVRERPCMGTRGIYKVKVRHGVSKVISGNRYVLGIIFHDAL
ncbi:MAG: 2OG-Fe(II) oxygenase [Sneathiella sp.]|nr:2OG-Fe(II) oxygenase [Sneathiella sp.]